MYQLDNNEYMQDCICPFTLWSENKVYTVENMARIVEILPEKGSILWCLLGELPSKLAFDLVCSLPFSISCRVDAELDAV